MPVDSDLAASRDRLKAANVSVAVDMQGKAKILVGATKVQQSDTLIPWLPDEMYNYCEMSEHERTVFRGLKMKLGCTTEFK